MVDYHLLMCPGLLDHYKDPNLVAGKRLGGRGGPLKPLSISSIWAHTSEGYLDFQDDAE